MWRVWLCFALTFLAANVNSKKNILFLVADDMRPDLDVYQGRDSPSPVRPKIHAPHLNSLSRKSLLLQRAYVQQAVCAPSRTSLLTGRRPDTTHVYDLHTYWRDVGGNFTTIPQYFKNHGYKALSFGKIFHHGDASNKDDPISWSQTPYESRPRTNAFAEDGNSWRAVPSSLLVNNSLQDTVNNKKAIHALRSVAQDAKSGKQPFFLAVGYHKPHLPFVFPETFLSYYPEDSIHVPPNQYAPSDMPPVAWANYGELRTFKDIMALKATGDINTTLPATVVKQLRRAYYSCISYIDSEIGKILKELHNQGLEQDTIIIFFGDHGWQLGEHGEWSKHTNFDVATHAPLMLHIPGKTDNGVKTEELVEFVDIFPTLVEAAGLPPITTCPVDSSKVTTCTEGQSFLPLIKTPETNAWKTAVFSQFPRQQHNQQHAKMGYSMTTGHYRYTEWVGFHGKPDYKPNWSDVHGVELYDHSQDPQENVNLAHDPAHKLTVDTYSKRLHAGWRAEAVKHHGSPIIG